MNNAKCILEFIKKDVYNRQRPDSLIIEELIQVVGFLNEKIENLESKINALNKT